MWSRLQNHPRLLEEAYRATHRLLSPLRGWLRPGSRAERLMIWGEAITKEAIFDCQMCGQCVLHSTGMTCPMTCPKDLRNGPCGGVRPDGHCEVIPEMPCVWVSAWERSTRMPANGEKIHELLAPLDNRLQDTSAWVNEFSGAADLRPAGWSD